MSFIPTHTHPRPRSRSSSISLSIARSSAVLSLGHFAPSDPQNLHDLESSSFTPPHDTSRHVHVHVHVHGHGHGHGPSSGSVLKRKLSSGSNGGGLESIPSMDDLISISPSSPAAVALERSISHPALPSMILAKERTGYGYGNGIRPLDSIDGMMERDHGQDEVEAPLLSATRSKVRFQSPSPTSPQDHEDDIRSDGFEHDEGDDDDDDDHDDRSVSTGVEYDGPFQPPDSKELLGILLSFGGVAILAIAAGLTTIFDWVL
ncbi:hypothetical protein IAR55_003813 [Kwoniella newhampshirensis]|uniref:Uncharacterized protein n=1 Tax=Kwoniella newhampshirensis TaxID=1651941 RepID=A0AAW0YYA6_9TREE